MTSAHRYADEILAMTKLDQEMRRAGREAWDQTVDERNTARLREIVEAIAALAKKGRAGL